MVMESTNQEVIYQGNSIISVEILSDYAHAVVIKRPAKRHPSRRSLRTLENEYEMTCTLSTVEGVRKALGQQVIGNQTALVLEYIDGETLRDKIARKTLDLRSRLEIAVALARVLGQIHQQNVIHLDLNSKNILIEKEQGAVHITDLGAASPIDRSGQLKVRPDQMLGTLPYISPEQTGRINRAVDERSDLYSLGVVYYELMTGQLPFDSKDPMELVHHHIARVPVSPSEISPEIPEVISAIILKLLSKNAEDRYQSAAGVQADLEKCLQRLSPEDTIEAFPLGEADYASRLRFPQKLYGRESDLKELESAFESACRENASMMFVGGFSGIGKTALVEELQKPASEKGGYFIRGKFDQYLRTTPYTAITNAFAEFVFQILVEPESAFQAWQDEVQSAVGDLGKVLTDVMPALEELIGAQPDVPQLGGQEAENRFNYVFVKFLLTVATKERPLVLFIDDVQWIDAASLRLLQLIQSDFNQPGLLVIGAYRDNEVDASHPLMRILDSQEQAGLAIRILKLDDLQSMHIESFLSDTLRSQEGIKELGTTIYEKTHGNPLFLRRLLSSLSEDGLIRFDSATHSWTWDIGDIGAKAPADNVADLLANTIARLPAAERDVLQIAACLGNRFDVATLALVVGRAKQEVEELLRATVTGQYVTQHDLVYEFVHDQVQQASYMLIDEASRAVRHLEIGRLLLADTDDTDLEERIFDIATHYNLGAHLLTDPAERLELVRLNLVAGRKARLAAAFAASAAYLKQGLSLLGEGAWRDHYCLTLDVHSELIQVSDLNIQYEEVEALFDVITEKAKQDVDAGVAHQTLIMSCIARHELGRAISLAERYLERLDVTLENERESDLTIAELYELPRMENREKLAATEILTAISTPVILSAPERFPSVVYTMLNLISRYGNNSMSSFAYSQYAMVLCLMQRYEEGNRFGQLAVDLLEKYSHPGRAAEIMNMQYANVRHWMQPVHEQITPLKTYHRMAMQAGSFEFAFYCLLNYLWLSWGSGKPLEHCLVEVEPSIGLCQSKNQRFSLLMSLLLAQMVLNLTGRSPSTTQLEGKWFSEETMMSRLEGNHFLLATYGLLKMKLCYLFGDPGAAYRQTRDVLKYRASLNPHYLYTKSTFYGALSCIAGLPDGESDADRQERLANLGLFEEELKLWAESAPMNYQHQYDLVMAEKSRVSDKHWEATQLYEKAIKGAQENQFAHDQALANELFGRFWLEQGNNRIAEMYLREARALYHQWGASAKVTHLEDSYPRWFKTGTAPKEQPDTTGRIFTTITQPITSIQLDLESITSASQLLAAETDLDQLCTKMISLVMANSGAEKGVLLLKQENEWFVQARKDITTDEHTALFHQPFDPTDRETELIPESVFNYCQRTKDVLVLGDAQLDQRFAEDRMIKNEIRSIACLPALSQGEVRALLYLENSQTAEVFTLENVGLLKHLSAQFAVSVENALLYANLSQLVEERTAHLQNEIEERKQAEEALQQSEEMYRDLVERISDVIYAVDTGGVITYLNPAIEALIGLPPEQVVGQPFAQFIHPEDLGRLQGNVQDLLAGTVPGTAEYRVLNASGETRWIRVTSQPIVDGDQVTSMQGLLTDITERKRIEEQLEEAATAAERQRLARELHDSVTQSLFSLDLFANATEQALATGRIERATENTRYICDLSQRALADMRLLIFELRPPVLEQEGLVGALRARLAAVEARAGLETEFNQTAVRPLPPAVESELYAVAREALNNTLKHARAEGVTVYLEFDEQSCCLTIADDGIGFDLEGAELGAGYGLRGMRERVESIDGRLTLETSPGRGTSVRVEVTV